MATDLMKKYGRRATTFQQVLDALIEFPARATGPTGSGRGAVKQMRHSPRLSTEFPLKVYDGLEQIIEGRVLDISEKGVGVQGIPAVRGEEKTLVVQFKQGSRRFPFWFDAICRWREADEQGPSTRV
jgi:hypothetical protein